MVFSQQASPSPPHTSQFYERGSHLPGSPKTLCTLCLACLQVSVVCWHSCITSKKLILIPNQDGFQLVLHTLTNDFQITAVLPGFTKQAGNREGREISRSEVETAGLVLLFCLISPRGRPAWAQIHWWPTQPVGFSAVCSTNKDSLSAEQWLSWVSITFTVCADPHAAASMWQQHLYSGH